MELRRASTVGAGAVLVALLGAQSGVTSDERAHRGATACYPASAHARVVHFVTSDRLRLVGYELGHGPRGVVLAHQYRGDACQWSSYGPSLAKAGYHVLAFDFRGFGRSPTGPGGIDLDVRAAASKLRTLGARTIVLIGASMGGTAVLTAAADLQPPPAAVVSLSGPASFDLMSALDTVPRLLMPKLFIVGANDIQFVQDARDLYRRARGPKQLLVIPAGDHGVALLDNPAVTRAIRTTLQQAFA
jgi:pimeloyl-ACP methyl ester carboxylesterase